MLNGKHVTNGVTNGVTKNAIYLNRRLAKAEKDKIRQQRRRAKLKIAKILWLAEHAIVGHGCGIIGDDPCLNYFRNQNRAYAVRTPVSPSSYYDDLAVRFRRALEAELR